MNLRAAVIMDKEAATEAALGTCLYSLMFCLRVCKLFNENKCTYITVTIGNGKSMQKTPKRIIILRGTLSFPSAQRLLKLRQLYMNMKVTMAICPKVKSVSGLTTIETHRRRGTPMP